MAALMFILICVHLSHSHTWLYMYLYSSVCIYHVHIHGYTCIYTHLCAFVTYTYMVIRLFILICVIYHIDIHGYTHVSTHLCAFTYTYRAAHMFILICVHLFVHKYLLFGLSWDLYSWALQTRWAKHAKYFCFPRKIMWFFYLFIPKTM